VEGSLVRISTKFVLGGFEVLLSLERAGSFAAKVAIGAGVTREGTEGEGFVLEKSLSVAAFGVLEGSLYGLFFRLSFSKMGEVVEKWGGELIGDGGMMLVAVW